MKKLNLTILVGLYLLMAMFMPCVNAEEGFDWMPPQVTDKSLNAQDLGGELIIPEIIFTDIPKPTADKSKFTKKYVIELKKFNISNDGTNADETSKGLNEALQHAKTLGANHIVFPKGTYLISENDSIVFDHTNTIVDLNGSTLQLRPGKAHKCEMVQVIDGTENFRLTNGTLRGDRYMNGARMGIVLRILSGRNLEFDNLILTKATGSCVSTQHSGNRTRPELLAMIMDSVYLDAFEQGAFSEQGKKIASTEKMRTIKPYDATKCKGEFEFGRGGLGFRAFLFIKGRVYQVYFYDKDMKFLEMKKRLQYQKVTVPEKAKFMHFEINQPTLEGKPRDKIARITDFHPPTDVHFHDCHFIDNRTLGLALNGGQKWILENNIFEDNGPDVVGWAIDLEDGIEQTQHIVLRNNVFKANHKGDLVICFGTELLIEGNTFDGNVSIWPRAHNYIVRNNKFPRGNIVYQTRTGIAKIEGNTYENCNVSVKFDTKAVADGIYRKPGETVATPPLTLENETMNNVSKITGTYFNFKNATLNNAHFVAGKETRMAKFEDCKFQDVSLEYEAEGPEVLVSIENCNGQLKEQGPGLDRKKLSQ